MSSILIVCGAIGSNPEMLACARAFGLRLQTVPLLEDVGMPLRLPDEPTGFYWETASARHVKTPRIQKVGRPEQLEYG